MPTPRQRGFSLFPAAEEAEPKYTIKEVMKKGMAGKESLLKKVASGKADDAEKKQLLELYTALAQNKPPKGDDKEWKAKCEVIVAACKDCVEGKDGAGQKLARACDCKACHTAHRAKAK